MTATVNLAPPPKQRFVDNNGNPLAGGKVFTYVAGSTTKQATYTDSTGTTQNANPVLLDSRGEASIWFDQSLAYKVVLAPAADTDPPTNPIWTQDGIPAYAGAQIGNSTSPSAGAGLVAFNSALSYPPNTIGGVMTGQGAAANFRSGLLLAGNGPWSNPASGDTQHLFELVNDNSPYQVFAMNSYGTAGVVKENNIHCNRYGGTLASPSNVLVNSYFMSWGYRGWDGTSTLSQSMAAFQYQATENWDSTHHGGRFKFENVKSGGGTAGSNRLPAWKLYAGPTDGVIMELGDETSLPSRILNASTTGFAQIHGSQDQAGAQSIWYGHAHATNPDEIGHRAARTAWQKIDGTEIMRLTPTGLAMNKGADATYTLDIKAAAANAFIVLATGGTTMLYSTNGTGTFATGENAAAASLYVRKDGTSNRSINAAGTINASGADYAEYMVKADGCGPLDKGAVIGVNAAGQLTDKWADAITFVVKSTNPSYVGGDVWGHADALGVEHPVEPVFTPDPYTGVDSPAGLNSDQEFEESAVATYQAALADFHAQRAAYEASVNAARAQFETDQMVPYRAALATFNVAHEAARQTVDRIAFSGQVPVNVLGAKPGDYIVPEPDGDGIKGVPVATPTFEQYLAAVGRVITIEADGRARVIVKVA